MGMPKFFEGTGMPDPGWWEALWPDPRGVLLASGLESNMKAVDLCSGDGWFTLPLAKLASRVWAIDIDAAMLASTQARLAEADISNCCLVEGDAYEIAGLISEKVDFVFMANAFHGVPDKTRLSGAVGSALKPNGIFAVVNWYPRPREETTVLGEPRGPATGLRMAPEATVAVVEAGGLKLSKVADVSPYHYAGVFRSV